MKKATYFIIQFIWSFFAASLIWYIWLKNAPFDFYHNNAETETLEGIILFVGLIIYLILTILYMLYGYKKVENRKAWMILVSVLICAGCGFLGTFAAVYGSELIHKVL